MFFEPPRTPYDLNWRMFGIPVRVHPLFWLIGVILGWNLVEKTGFGYLLLWIACVFVSILIHEMGHVVVGRFFGSGGGYIVLHSMGGLAVGSSNLRNRWQRILVYLAGPLAQFVLLGLVWLLSLAIQGTELPRLVRGFLLFMFEINLFWAVLNLLPIWPLDGGRISNDFLGAIIPERAAVTAMGISVATAGLLALNALSVMKNERALPLLDHVPFLKDSGDWYMVLFFGWLAFNSVQAMIALSQRPPWDRGDEGF